MPVELARDFNTALFIGSRREGRIHAQYPTLKMTSTRIEISFNKVARLDDLTDLAEMLFPGNRNQQHALLVVLTTLKWADHHMVPNFAAVAAEHRISRRTLERVRAKMRRIGLIDHVSRFNADHGYREGWVLSNRFERSLRELAERVGDLKDSGKGSDEKDRVLIGWAEVRRRVTMKQPPAPNQHDG